MDRSIPVSNKLISQKIHEKNRQIHLAKLNSIKSSISRQAPLTFTHLKSNKKRHQLYENKLTEIERENRILLEKLTTIMKNPNKTLSVDKQPRSLNKEVRKKELVKITIENQAMLKRLKEQRSMYDHNSWLDERKKAEIYLRNISEYPLSLYATTSKTPMSPSEENV
jgi:hypothetical protein